MPTPRPAQDPVIELMGWRGEPLLLRRLKYHVGEAVFETSTIIVAMHLAELQLTPSAVFIRLLCLPLVVIVCKLCWALQLAWGYFRMKSAGDINAVMRRMSCLNSRSHWAWSVAIFTFFSCLLMVWHAIVFLLMLCYNHDGKETFAVQFLMYASASLVALNWSFWRDFVRNYKETPDREGSDLAMLFKLELLCKMYKSKAIQSQPASAIAHLGGEAKICAVCLEDFKGKGTLARLPCGHVFHPRCINRWVLEDWRCPFRCSLDTQRPEVTPRVMEAWTDPAEAVQV
eukprot:TRINITY_DN20531_c0_g1_i3.p1 TRINITY_DN20531_c0_g1~~TRINITY_DN20531_c0_g1_i3.p1  ORF type:complete len:305 (-),score=49.76 TRINITY_DN20531_c0_g1_i3:91-948(-)